MTTLHKSQAAIAPITMQTRPQLTVIQGMPRERMSLFDALVTLAFGHLNGGDFPSPVHDVLDLYARPAFFSTAQERVFAVAASCVATVTLFVLSFI